MSAFELEGLIIDHYCPYGCECEGVGVRSHGSRRGRGVMTSRLFSKLWPVLVLDYFTAPNI